MTTKKQRARRATAMREWRRKNPEKWREISLRASRKWRLKHPEKARADRREWALKNPEKTRAKNRRNYWAHRDARRIRKAKWCREHPEKCSARSAARRAGIDRAMPRWVDRVAIERFYDEAKRLTLETGIIHHVDHIYPLTHPWLQGLHVPWNLQIIPAINNIRKNNRVTPEMLKISLARI